MKYKVDHDYHLHSFLSPCSGDKEHVPERMMKYAVKNNYNSICITDHFWDSAVSSPVGKPEFYNPLNYDYISQWRPLPQADGVKFYFGCECELLRDMTLGISREVMDKMDFIVIPPNHFHMEPHTIPSEVCGNAGRIAEYYMDRLDRLIELDLPFYKMGLAHFTDSLTAPYADDAYAETISLMNPDRLTDFFGKAAAKGFGIELNFNIDYIKEEWLETVLKPYRIASECGCKFYLGSDAHTTEGENTGRSDNFKRIVDLLQLDECQKYHIPDKK